MTKELGCTGIETSLEQWRFYSCCCSNPEATANEILLVFTERLQSKVSKNKGYVATWKEMGEPLLKEK